MSKQKQAAKAEDQKDDQAAAAPAPVSPTATEQPEPADQEPAAAAQQDAGKSRPAVPDAAAAEAIAAFLADWRQDVPAEAAGGSYSPHARDRFGEQDYSGVPDGMVFSKGWIFVFDDGRFVAAADLSTAREDVFVPKGQVIGLSAA